MYTLSPGYLQVQIQLNPFSRLLLLLIVVVIVFAAAVAVAPMLAINIIACCTSVHHFVCLDECVCARVCVRVYNEIKHNKRQNKF